VHQNRLSDLGPLISIFSECQSSLDGNRAASSNRSLLPGHSA
jgi:hypothetical protein